jgi:hypothetical protein
MGFPANFGDGDKFGRLCLQPARNGGIQFNMEEWGLVPANSTFFYNIQLLGILVHFPVTTWQPMTGPRGEHSLAHVTFVHSHYHVTYAWSTCHFTY